MKPSKRIMQQRGLLTGLEAEVGETITLQVQEVLERYQGLPHEIQDEQRVVAERIREEYAHQRMALEEKVGKVFKSVILQIEPLNSLWRQGKSDNESEVLNTGARLLSSSVRLDESTGTFEVTIKELSTSYGIIGGPDHNHEPDHPHYLRGVISKDLNELHPKIAELRSALKIERIIPPTPYSPRRDAQVPYTP